MSGVDLYDELTRRHPDLAARLVIITGQVPAEGDVVAATLGRRYIMKTKPIGEIRALLRALGLPLRSVAA